MTTAPDTSDANARTPQSGALGPPRRLAAAVGGVILLVGLLAAGRWWMTPDLFPNSGASMSVNPRSVTRAAMTVGVTAPYTGEQTERTELTFTDGAAVELSTNTAEAQVDVAVCRAKPGADPIGVVSLSDVDEFCDEVEPVGDGVGMSQGHWEARERDYVIITLTPTRPGKVRLAEVSLSYRTDRSQFYRRGTDTIGLDVLVSAR
jgi:hypothetical protein